MLYTVKYCFSTRGFRAVLFIVLILASQFPFEVYCDVIKYRIDQGIDNYVTPGDCLSYYTKDYSGVALRCEVPVINKNYDGDYFERMPSKYTKSLLVRCNNPHLMESSLKNMSISHLQELQELVLIRCKFVVLERETFRNCSNGLIYVTVSCGHDYIHSLTIEESSFQFLSHVLALNVSHNNVKTIPRGELCYLTNLEELYLHHNNLSNITELSFSECRNPRFENCGNNIILLDLSHNEFVSLVNDSFCTLRHLQEVSFHRNNVRYVEPRAFANLNQLMFLDLSFNKLSEIPSENWRDLVNLAVLNISSNFLKGKIDKTTFEGLVELQFLDLCTNQIDFIEEDTFENMVKLKYLGVSYNFIAAIQDGTFNCLPDLRSLLLDHNMISTITNKTFIGLMSLVELKLNNNSLIELDHFAFLHSSRLVNISLNDNRLQHVPSFQGLTGLEVVDFSNNDITDLSEETFSGLGNMTGLTLARNSLQEIPPNVFRNLTKLVVLNLSDNNLTTLPNNCLKNNTQLSFLNLSKNNLMSLGSLQYNTRLIYVDISNNNLRSLDYETFPPSLLYLNANSNKIVKLEEKFYIANNIHITSLFLAHNQLTAIRSTSLPPTLQILDLSYNTISKIDSNIFLPMKELKIVNLAVNNLSSFSKAVLKVNPANIRRPEFHLTGNRLQCTCDMIWMTYINNAENKEFGYIEDLSALYCWMPRRRGKYKLLKPVVDVSTPEFECQFWNHSFAELVCFKITSSPKDICDVACPENCSCWRSQSWDTVIVDCSLATWTSVQPNIPAMVKVLYLDGNSIAVLDKNSFEEYPLLLELFLNNTGLQSIGINSFRNMTSLQKLVLDSNYLETLVNGTFNGLSVLKELFLSNNRLRHISEDVFQPLYSLQRVELQHNNLFDFPVWVMDSPALAEVKMGYNPWSCNCDYMEKYWSWTQTTQTKVLDIHDVFCYFNNDTATKLPLMEFNSTECMENYPAKVIWHQPFVTVLLMFFVAVTVISILLFMYRHEMQVLIYSRYGLRLFYNNKEVDDERKLYDAFVSYSNPDEEFVVRQLVPKLEEIEVPYKLCLHQRDFAAGAFITESILDAVEYSRRTIIVFTKHFLQSDWCRFEFKSAHMQMMKDKCNRIVMIVKGEVPTDLDSEMKLYLKTNTYLNWDDKLFWQKLYFALPDKKSTE